jgi:hypothetical protein
MDRVRRGACGLSRSLSGFKWGIDMRQTSLHWTAVLPYAMATPAVLESAQFAGQAVIPPSPPMDFTLKTTAEAMPTFGDWLQQITVLINALS